MPYLKSEVGKLQISRVWAMPNKWTFKVAPLRAIIDKYKKIDNIWFDPFAGLCSPCEVTNDLNPKIPATCNLDAIDFVRYLRGFDGRYDGAVFDPPYSLTQVARSYNNYGLKFNGKDNPTGGFPKVKDIMADLVITGGYVISYGWNTVGMGKSRGFKLIEVLVCCHGGSHHDTLVTVERKLEEASDAISRTKLPGRD